MKEQKKGATGLFHRFTLASFKSRRKRNQADRRISRTRIEHSFRIFNRSVGLIRRHWEVFGGLTLIYLIIGLILVGSNLIGGDEILSLKDQSDAANGTGGVAGVQTGVLLYGGLLEGAVSQVTGAASAYQMILLIIFSLIFIWAIRQLYEGNKVRVRDALYNATYPLIQVLLVIAMIFVHLIPALVGMFFFSALILNGILTVAWQQVSVTVACVALLTWTTYLLCASVFALYIATLPGMTPLAALRTAKRLVKFRRAAILRKLVYLPLVLIPISAVVVIPIALFATAISPLFFSVIATICLPLVHSYMYELYRELIKE